MKHPSPSIPRLSQPGGKSCLPRPTIIRESHPWPLHPMQPIVNIWTELEVCLLDLFVIDYATGKWGRSLSIHLVRHTATSVNTLPTHRQAIHRVGGLQSC